MALQEYREFVERVRGATDIVRLLGEYVPLRKLGRRYKGLCPFHPEKTPSFSVDEEKQLFFCFGCQTGGDAFRFLMLYEKLEFQEAVKLLGEKAGIEPPRPAVGRGGSDSLPRSDRDGLLEIHQRAAEFYRKTLQHPKDGEPGREYLASRGLTEATVEALGLGYAPASWDGLKTHLVGLKFPARLLAASGLFSQRESGTGYYDRFRDRVMFPIRGSGAARDKVIAFGGRAIGTGEMTGAKYVNSPESPIYSKGAEFYGLALSREAIRREGWAVVVEGYLDFAALWEAGVQNTVATLGTAFTQGQAQLLSRLTRQVTVNYDPDPAGMNAARRSLDLLLSKGFSVKVLRLQDGLDPDAFVRRRGAEAYRGALSAAPGCVDFLLAEAVRNRDMADPAAQAEALNEVLGHVALFDSPAERSGYYGRIAEVLGIEDGVILEQVRKVLRTGARPVAVAEATGAVPREAQAPPTEAETRLVQVLLQSGEAREALLPLEPIEFAGMRLESVIRAIEEIHASGEPLEVPSVMGRLPEGEERNLLARIAFRELEQATPEEGGKCLAALRRDRMVDERRKVQKEIDQAGVAVPEFLLRRKMELSREINKLS